MEKRLQRLIAMLTVFALLFCHVDFSSLAEKNGGEDGLPAAACGLEEHTHTEACYENVLTCGQEESAPVTQRKFASTFKVHRHNDDCYDKAGNLICGMIAGEYYHTHNEFCRDENGNVVCGLETRKPHVHTAECYRQDKKLICGKEETEGHTHGDACWETTRELVCETPEDPGHHHSEACYTPRKELTCGKEEDPGHHHTEDCYKERKELTCGQEESGEHTHTEACYTTYRDLVCGQEERDGHTHTEACYTLYNDLTCGQEERDGHTHTDTCWRETKKLICGLEETEGHTHGDECFETVDTLICDRPDTTHRHTKDCYDENGRLKCGKWEIPTFTCTEENWITETVSEGHSHSEACYERKLICGKEEHTHTDDCYPKPAEEPTEQPEGEPTEQPEGEPTEQPEGEPTEQPEGEPTEQPEGEPTEQPEGEPTEQPEGEPTEEPEAEATEEPAEEPEEVTIPSAKDAPFRVSVSFAPDAGIPEGTELVVTDPDAPASETPEKKSGTGVKAAPVKRRSLKAAAADAESSAEVPSLTVWPAGEPEPEIELYRKTIDISLVAEGKEIEPDPESRITVTVELPGIEAGQDVEVYHTTAEGTERLESVNDAGTVTFVTNSFSLFTFVSGVQQVDAWNTELTENTFSGKTAYDSAAAEQAEVTGVPEGLKVAEAYNLTGTGELWMTTRYIGEPPKGDLESVALYALRDGELAGVVRDGLTDGETLRFSLNDLSSFALVRDSGLRHRTEELDGVVLDGMMPKTAQAAAADVTADYTPEDFPAEEEANETVPEDENEETDETEETKEEGTVETRILAAYDISILNGETEYQPDEEHPITVKISVPEIMPESRIRVWHIRDDGTKEEVTDFTLEEGKVTFEATGFSAYAIVSQDFKTIGEYGWKKVSSFARFTQLAETGLYVSSAEKSSSDLIYYFWKNNIIPCCNSTGDSGRSGIEKTGSRESNPDLAPGAAPFYFEPAGETGKYYIYFKDGSGNRTYLRNNNGNQIFAAGTTDRTAFTVTYEGNSHFSFKADVGGNWWINMTNDDAGRGFAAWSANNAGSKMCLWYYESVEEEPYGLDGKSYGLMNWTGGVAGKAMMSSAENAAGALDARALTILVHEEDRDQRLFAPKNSEITMWTFEWLENDVYHLKTSAGGTWKYLRITTDGVFLTDNAEETGCRIQVVPGTGNHSGQISLKGEKTLTYSGNVNTGFSIGGSAGSEYLYLVEESELTEEYFLVYSADKVSVSDEAKVANGSKVIVYTRFWNDRESRYDFYAIDHDGSLVPVYESGDVIQWVGSQLNTMLWDFIEYYWEGTNEPNYFYELYNEYSEKYIAPQLTGSQTLSDGTLGINLNGRRNKAYYSPILAWDEKSFAYAGLRIEEVDGEKRLVTCSKNRTADFYFAIVQDTPVEDVISEGVATVDNNDYGIKMRIADMGSREEMRDIIGSNEGGAGTTLHQGLLSTNLVDGYPTTKANRSLGDMYAGADPVNHLFIASTYYSSGYYEFDSSQNFASLQGDGNFRVYQELGTHEEGDPRPSLQHGQFLPFNDIEAGVFSTENPYNLYSATLEELPETDPRKREKLYKVTGNPDFYFAMELEASFTQTPNGKDAWNHDIIYQFTGDDDFWLYVNDELVIDLGGIHSAVAGSVNFSTGAVRVNGKTTMKLNGQTVPMNLRNIFESNFRKRNPTASQADVNHFLAQYFDEGSTIFKDYSSHTMKIFYMERGAGASNLHMRFNLASVRPGHVLLSKTLEGVDTSESQLVEYPYQFWYRVKDSDDYQPLADTASDIHVYYADTDTPVRFMENLTIDGVNYRNVFMLKPGETADISVPTNTIEYYVVECGLTNDLYSSVAVKELASGELTAIPHDSITDYKTNIAEVVNRPRVTFINTVDPSKLGTLTITKNLYNPTSTGVYEPLHHSDDDQEFEYRLYLKSALEELTDNDYASMHTYHVKDEEGYYCSWDTEHQKFVRHPGNITDYSTVTDEAVKEALTINTSIYGSVASIPNEYTVEVRGLMPGTRYRVVERPANIPDGYTFWRYRIEGDSTPPVTDAAGGITESIEMGANEAVQVDNLKGWGLRVTKEWTDEDFMADRSCTYFALYQTYNGTEQLVEGSVRKLDYGETSHYWYYNVLPDVPDGEVQSLMHYVIREVTLDAPVTESGEQILSGGVHPVADGGTLTLTGRMKQQSTDTDLVYTVHYTDPELIGTNMLTQTVTNDRPGVELIKTDWNGNPLKGAEFTLTLPTDGGDGVRFGPYVSDSAGRITTAYLLPGWEYILEESSAPRGYYGLQSKLTLVQDSSARLTVTGGSSDEVTVTQGGATGSAAVTVKNRKMDFRVVKKGGQDLGSAEPIEHVKFALYREKTVNGVTSIDLIPMAGYAALFTDADGIVPSVDENLNHGTYELHEKEVPPGYQSMSLPHIKFTIHASGEVTLDKEITGVRLLCDTGTEGEVNYTMEVLNYQATSLTITKRVRGELSTDREFTFKLVSVEKQTYGTKYAWEKTDPYGTVTDSTATGGTPLSTKKDENTFTLKHGEKMIIEVPKNKKIVIEEVTAATDEFTTAWKAAGGSTQSGETTTVQVTLSTDTTVTVTNTQGPVQDVIAPTGWRDRKMPFLLLAVTGVMLLIPGSIRIRKRKRKRGDPSG